MGGSVIVRASGPLLSAKFKIAGVAVLDVVEGIEPGCIPVFESRLIRVYSQASLWRHSRTCTISLTLVQTSSIHRKKLSDGSEF